MSRLEAETSGSVATNREPDIAQLNVPSKFDDSLCNQGIYSYFKYIAEQHADQTAIICDDHTITYAQLVKKIEACIGLIEKAGGAGNAVVILFPNSIEFIVAVFATCAVNGIVVALNPGFKETEIKQYLDSSQPKIVFSADTTVEQMNLQACFDGVIYNASDILAAETKPYSGHPIEVSVDKPALYMFSSGSTGKSKRVTRSQRQILSEYRGMANTIGLTSADRILCTVPLYHAHGFCNAMLAALLSGGQFILLMLEFNARRTIQALEKYRITIYPAVPFMYKMMASTRFNQAPDLSCLRLLISAGAPLTQAIADDFYQKFAKPVSQLYGSTETGAITINAAQPLNKPLSVGLPVNGVKVSIRDENGHLLAAGIEGEIWISSPAMTACYDGLMELSQECFVDEWFFAGDLGHLDGEGFLYITGRKKLLLIVAGNKVDPLEVEEVLRGCDKVQDAVVVGVTHPDYGQMIKAFVVPTEGSDCTESDIVNYARAELAEYKIPKRVEFIAEIPRSPLGKILRKYLE